MLDLFLSISGAHTRFRVPRTSMREFLVSKNFAIILLTHFRIPPN